MGKTNFSKVEKSLEEGLIKITSRHLLDEAPAAKNNPSFPPQDLLVAQLQSMARDLKKLHALDSSIYKKLGFPREKLKKLIANPSSLTLEEWQKIKVTREKIALEKQNIAKNKPFEFDEDIVEKERLIQKNRRFNINDKWLPLK